MRVGAVVLAVILWAGQGIAAGAPSSTPRVTGAWARTTPVGAANGVVYLRVTSPRADRLVGVIVAPDVAGSAELHATMGASSGAGGMANMPSMGGSGGSGTTRMRPLAAVRLPARTPVVFAPGGRHVMLVGLARTLVRGDTFPLTLQFERASSVTVTVKVRDTAP
ncbi:MAG: copper chaperone PCu(A)C [Acidimicrobiia bacterium]